MARNGTEQCPSCRTRITFEDNEMVDAMPPDDHEPCDGCLRLLPILEESARKKALLPPPPEPGQELTPAAIFARLQQGRTRPPEHDWAKDAAGDRD